MHSGAFKSGRKEARKYHGSVRPIRIENMALKRNGEDVEVRFDAEFDDLWRYKEDDGPGNWSAAWFFIKFRSTNTTKDCSKEELINRLAPAAHLPGDLAEDLKKKARNNFEDALKHLPELPKPPPLDADAKDAPAAPPAGGAPPPMDKDALAKAALAMAGSVTFGGVSGGATAEKQPPAEQADADEAPVRFLNLPRTHLIRGAGGASPGSTAAQTDMVTIACRTVPGGDMAFDFKELTAWNHGHLSTVSADHKAPAGMTIEATDDGMGVFLHRAKANPGAGPTSVKGIVLKWKAPAEMEFPVRVWVHATEMIYVPQGAFELGDPEGLSGPVGCFHASRPEVGHAGARRWTWKVENEDAIPVCDIKDKPMQPKLTWDNRGQWGERGDIPAHFPKGYKAFYCMRRQLTQGEYTDFINSLQGHAKTCRFPYGGQGYYRYTMFKTEGGLRACTRPNRANNWVNWPDSLAYLWWAGLRPMTEMEYEKACRGFAPAVPGEYAWGTTMLEQANVIKGDEASDEVVTGNSNLDNPYQTLQGGDGSIGPVRDDAFTLPGTGPAEERDKSGYAVFVDDNKEQFVSSYAGGTRQSAGSSYWGIMALTGNLWEFVITAGNDEGRAFCGEHGTGELKYLGIPKEEDVKEAAWPWIDAKGIGFRGGSWYTCIGRGMVSDRGFGSGLEDYVDRSHDTGFRGARTAKDED